MFKDDKLLSFSVFVRHIYTCSYVFVSVFVFSYVQKQSLWYLYVIAIILCVFLFFFLFFSPVGLRCAQVGPGCVTSCSVMKKQAMYRASTQ